MNKDTNAVTFYIIIFFVVVLVSTGVFFAYKIFFENAQLSNNVNILDKEFNDIIRKKEEEARKRKENKSVEYADYESPPCLIGEHIYKHGELKDFFSRAAVGVYETCANFSEIKKCDNGI